LHVYAAVALFHAPPGFHAPKESAVFARRLFAFVFLAGVFHFRDAHRRTSAVRPLPPVVKILNVMFGVQHHGDYFVPPEPQEHAEMVAVARFDF